MVIRPERERLCPPKNALPRVVELQEGIITGHLAVPTLFPFWGLKQLDWEISMWERNKIFLTFQSGM